MKSLPPPPPRSSKEIIKGATPFIREVLRSSGCLQYEAVLLSEGFDRVEALGGIDKDDMRALGISESEGEVIKREAEKYLHQRRR
jgi:hypothetical protein